MVSPRVPRLAILTLVALTHVCACLRADVITEWDSAACRIVDRATLPPSAANHALTVAQTAVFEAVNAVTQRYSGGRIAREEADGVSTEAAVAAAYRLALGKMVPSQLLAVDSTYQMAIARVKDGPEKVRGIALGQKAAAAVLASPQAFGPQGETDYRPYTTPGVYVPTVIPFDSQTPQRTPWLMTASSQFRPSPPPSLKSPEWARDYNEIKEVGSKNSSHRTAEQTKIARFWEETTPSIYHGIIRSVARMPGRDVTQNARLFAAVTQAMDDAITAVFEAKYYYNRWRPITAIRNGDIDSNEATQRDPTWIPFINTPLHPEYPCAHCIVSGAVGTVLKAEIGNGPMPVLTTTSSAAGGISRSWSSVEDFMKEVAEARICDGVHFRSSTEVGTNMGRMIGQLAAARLLQAPGDLGAR